MDETHIRYIFDHYFHLMTPAEHEAWRGMGLLAVGGPYGPVPRSLASMSDDPQVVALAAKGREVFRRDVAERIAREHPAEVVFNYCPECKGLCRTPKAKQCPHCKHRWHSR
jgi:hypothetical protein